MANESKQFAHQVIWFSTLLSKKDNIRPLQKTPREIRCGACPHSRDGARPKEKSLCGVVVYDP
ncbi:ribosomal RNA large subunit methyltransferase F [Vibrio variabilis]|uniref:Ribosomal RNA large subunit methyltransferase F n=1 Tax=Vibrio variabilis TaxID=990271 RepID=A0ABQ0JG06_9VIBR|nr:ribosomal RNA large subunit methyltransferase F [Vibrio variabilis]